MSELPLVTVAIPSYRAAYFESALQSALLQSYPNIEILVSDDCPGDTVSEVVSRYSVFSPFEIRIVRNNPGLGTVRNFQQCVELARGEFLKFLCDDDILLPTCVERMVDAFRQSETISLVTSKRLLINEEGGALPPVPFSHCPFSEDLVVNGSDLISYLSENPMNFLGEPTTVMFRRSSVIGLSPNIFSFNGVGFFSINDLVMYVSILKGGDLAYLVQPLSCFRQHGSQNSNSSGLADIWRREIVELANQIRSSGLYNSQLAGNVRVSLPENRDWQFFPLKMAMEKQEVKPFSDLCKNGGSPVSAWLGSRVLNDAQRSIALSYINPLNLRIYLLGMEGEPGAIKRTLESLKKWAGIDVVVISGVFSPPEDLGSLRLLTAGDDLAASINQDIEQNPCDWLMFVQAGVEFTFSGLHMLSVGLSGGPTCDAVYADEIVRDEGDLGALFRPDFNLDLLLSLPGGMASHWIFRRNTFLELGGFDSKYPSAQEFDLIVRLIEEKGTASIGHLDEPLLVTDVVGISTIPAEVEILERHLRRRGYPNGKVLAELPGRYRLIYGHEDKPLVSIIVPTKDQLPMLLRCITSLLEKTRYPNFEVLIVDNNSETPEAREWLDGVANMGTNKIRVLRYPHPFNYSAINNMAAREARGEYLVLLNNDTAILHEDWLEALMNHGQRPEVGIVGAKLLYPDGKIQHAGVILGLRGPADHPFIGREGDDPGYMQRMQVDQNLSVVTAACLLIRKSIYEQVGGLDEEAFKVSYNDVDLCLKVQQAGYLTVWTPHSVVMHVGSVSQTNVDPAKAEAKRQRFMAEQDAMYEKWLPVIARDPAYNPNLSLIGNGFELEENVDLTWKPLSWRPLPVVLAHMADMAGCGQYRVIQPFNAAKEAGLIDGALSGRLLSVPEVERFNPDSIVLQRQLMEHQLEILARTKKFSRAFKVYELDDYIPNLPVKSVHRAAMPKDVVKSLRKALTYVDRFVVSTEPLAEALAGMHGDIQVARNSLDPRWWGNLTSERRVSSKPRVGWAGGISHTGDLEMIADVVKELANEVEWVFFGMCPDKLRPYVHEYHPGVDIELYPAALARMNLDLAIAPVEENLFNECKSNLRLLEYGACGFPVVCSDLVCYRGDLPVTRVRNRFKDWVDAIRMHLADLDATAKQGDALRAAVLRDWMLEGANLERWRQVWLP